eukprot:9543465-Alexandrium_andersonii.AAC.1
MHPAAAAGAAPPRMSGPPGAAGPPHWPGGAAGLPASPAAPRRDAARPPLASPERQSSRAGAAGLDMPSAVQPPQD